MTDKVRLQNLREMTVQIRRASDDAIVGTGIAVSTDGKIVTCAHVVQAALSGTHPRNANSNEIGVYFPQARGGETKERKAIVAKCFPQHDDDVVLLQLVGGASPLAPEQIAVLGKADGSEGNDFRSYGYASLGPNQSRYVDGQIMGPVEMVLPEGTQLYADPIELRTRDIRPGVSGAAVLDEKRNLVVGLITSYWNPGGQSEDDNVGWSTNTRVLAFDPFNFDLREDDLEKRAAPQPKTDVAEAQAKVAPTDRFAWNSAPAVLAEWTGRNDLLEKITRDWNEPDKHVTGLIGFGGEGKSSLARKWVETLKPETFNGLFWWGFYENRSVDEFLEAALKWMSGGRIDLRAVPSSSLRAQIIGAMLGAGRYLFVLDGLEVMQHQEGDRFGLLQSNDLRDLLTYFARPDNQSFLLVTSRAPLLDLMEYTTYTHRDVDRLSATDGRALVRKLGVQGKDDALDKLVADWDGHALTLSLLSAILTERYGGDVAHVSDLPAPTMNEPRYERVHRVLRRYDEHLTDAEREFLKLFSAFRTPVREDALEKVFVPLLNITAKHAESAEEKTENQKPDDSTAKKSLRSLFGFASKKQNGVEKSKIENSATSAFSSAVKSLVERLVTYRILRFDAHDRTYTTHPLIRNHYLALLTKGDRAQEKATHGQIKAYYLSIAGDTPQFPTLDDLKPLIEVVHHACHAEAYDEAWNVLWQRIYQQNSYVIAHQLGAYDTALSVLFEFFEDGDVTTEPKVSNRDFQRWILNSVGHHLMSLGRLREAAPFYERKNAIALEMQDWHNASNGYRNLSSLHAYLGALKASVDAAVSAIDLAHKAEDKDDECKSQFGSAWVAHLAGDTEIAKNAFKKAEELQRETDPSLGYLRSQMGVGHAEFLRRARDVSYARRVADANLLYAERNHYAIDLSPSHRVLGDLDSDAGQHDSARAHYGTALKIARSISARYVLIEALLARGRWAAKYMKDATSAFNDLNEALGYAVEGGYRIYEVDIRVALAWANITPIPSPSPVEQTSLDKGRESARVEAERALRMSEEMGYYWGKVDAEKVLEKIRIQESESRSQK